MACRSEPPAGQRHGRSYLAGGHARQPGVLLFVRAGHDDHAGDHAVPAHRPGQAHPSPGQFLGDQGEAGGGDPGAAVALGDDQAEDTELLHRLDQLGWVGVLAFEIVRHRQHAVFHPVVGGGDDVSLVRAEVIDLGCCHGGLSPQVPVFGWWPVGRCWPVGRWRPGGWRAGLAPGQVHDSGIGGRVNAGVDDRRPVPVQGRGQFRRQPRRVADHRASRAQRGRGGGERRGPVADRLRPAVAGRPLLDLDQAEGRVVEHHDHDPQPEPDGGLDLHQGHAQAAVAGEGDHRRAGSAQGGGDRRGQRVAHGGQAAGDEQTVRLVHLPQRHGHQHVRASIDGGDRFRRGMRPDRGDNVLG